MFASILERQAAVLGSRAIRSSRPARPTHVARLISTSTPVKLGESSRSAAEPPLVDDEFGFDELARSAQETDGIVEPESLGLR